jgi:L,D-transpeptidase YcbB
MKISTLTRWLSCSLLLFLLLPGCRFTNKKKEALKKDIDITIPGSFEPVSQKVFDSTMAAGFFRQYPGLSSVKNDWLQFYQQRNYSFAWVDSSGLSAAAQNLHNRINNLQDDGLDSSLPYRTEFNKLFDDAATLTGTNTTDSALIYTEMMLTAQYFLYARNIYETLGDGELKKLGWNINRKKISFNEYLNKELQSNGSGTVFEHEPVYQQYNLLKKFLRNYRQIAQNGGWPVVDTSIKKLLPGDSAAAIPQIKNRLFLSGDYNDTFKTKLFDAKLAAAIKQFRNRHGLRDTALIDKPLLLEMNIPVEKRIEQLLVNMERCRWLPNNPGPDYISVNIPDYKMYVYEKDSLQFTINVVVGQTATKTTIFNDTLQTIAFSPYWNVPYSIYKKEIAPRLSSRYLRRNNMEYTGGGVRQKPGGNNALGKVKFLFPNSYNIYFHDTPAKDKFNYTQRTFSHGCIRLAEPKKLAMYLLRNEPIYTEPVIDSLMNQTRETQVQLKKKLPVYILYMTAFVNVQTGQLQFRKDVYGQDKAVMERMAKR